MTSSNDSITITKKRCNKCGIEYPLTAQFWYRRKSRPLGFQSNCKFCGNAAAKQYRQQHPEKRIEYYRRWATKNKDRIVAYSRLYEHTNKAKRREQRLARYKLTGDPGNKLWKKRHPERVRLYSQRYNEKHADVLPDRRKLYIKNNPEKRRAYEKHYRQRHPDKLHEKDRRIGHRRRARELAAEGSFNDHDIKVLFKQQNGRCWWCLALLPKRYHVDHRIPLTRGGTNWPSNLVLACPTCNCSKQDKMPWEWCGRLL